MEKRQLTALTTEYVGYEEEYVNGDKGKRVINYYLKRKNGDKELAIIGKEKSFRQFSYRFLLDFVDITNFVKFRSRKELLLWLQSLFPESPNPVSSQTSDGSIDGIDYDEFDAVVMKNNQIKKFGLYKEFLWVGSSWTCKRRRKHYQAFSRNGIKILVNQFVYVLAEEDNRLVAYLDDLYEDAKGNKMVVVRWFHKLDEVGIDLPRDFNDREIFFSLCLQDLSVECIDGSALVLSPEHYTKFQKEVEHTQLDPFVCYRQYDNEDLKPFDVTQVKGYWKQQMLRYLLSHTSVGSSGKCSEPDVTQKKWDNGDLNGTRPRKRLRLSGDSEIDLEHETVDNKTMDVVVDLNVPSNTKCMEQGPDFVTKSGILQNTVAAATIKDINIDVQCTTMGSQVEVLSQDSGMRGCWFRAVIIKKSKNKVKLRYHDIKDADNEANCLEEWVLASRIAACDEMGIRMYGRTTIRPAMVSHNAKVSWVINVGTIVDVWRHNGWWEGVVIQADSDEKIRVYFPGEKQEAVISRSDLRHSQEWIAGTWKELVERPDVAAVISSDQVKEAAPDKTDNYTRPQTITSPTSKHIDYDTGKGHGWPVIQHCSTNCDAGPPSNEINNSCVVDLSKDDLLSRLRWNSSGKRKRTVLTVQKPQLKRIQNGRTHKSGEDHHDLVIPSTLKMEKDGCKSSKADRDKCKYMGESLFGSSAVPALSSLVMSR